MNKSNRVPWPQTNPTAQQYRKGNAAAKDLLRDIVLLSKLEARLIHSLKSSDGVQPHGLNAGQTSDLLAILDRVQGGMPMVLNAAQRKLRAHLSMLDPIDIENLKPH